ncbi:hypothetical protein FRC17_009090 [Serendipita sp. 399]|nr:hypothetical protein FRC17_009090 [Serendipita sp. 399]
MGDALRASFGATIAVLHGAVLKSPISDAEFGDDANLCIEKSNQEITDWWKFTGGSLSTMKKARIFAVVGADFAGGFLNGEYQQHDIIALKKDVSEVRKAIRDLKRNFDAQAISVRAGQAGLGCTIEEAEEKRREGMDRNPFVWWLKGFFSAAVVEQKEASWALLTRQANTLSETKKSFDDMYQFLRQVRKWLLQVEMDLETVERHLQNFDCAENRHLYTTRANTIKSLLTTLSGEFFAWIDEVDSLKVDCPGDLLCHFDEPEVKDPAITGGRPLTQFWPFKVSA